MSARTAHARQLFAPLGPVYDRNAALLSFGQDPRWRTFLVSRIPDDALRVVDVATGTASVALELARRVPSRHVVGVDQSPEMLRAGRERVDRAGLSSRIELREGRAEELPFGDDEFDALTFTYLLRYVDDPLATMRGLARVVRPGGVLAMQEFGLPRGLWRPLWELYVRGVLPVGGVLTGGRAWWEVGRFLGPSIREFHTSVDVAQLWREAGIADVHVRSLSLGGGVVVWGTRT
ncbi:MAG TPA: class I SAM-dependent methyltransferase [Conexibacter sp.]|nr:class I SAM-dependent methyltransferase [Conexibacter sp.]